MKHSLAGLLVFVTLKHDGVFLEIYRSHGIVDDTEFHKLKQTKSFTIKKPRVYT